MRGPESEPTEDKWFVGTDDKALCAQMAERVTQRGTEEFAHHVEGDFLIDLAFVGLRGGAARWSPLLRKEPQAGQIFSV